MRALYGHLDGLCSLAFGLATSLRAQMSTMINPIPTLPGPPPEASPLAEVYRHCLAEYSTICLYEAKESHRQSLLHHPRWPQMYPREAHYDFGTVLGDKCMRQHFDKLSLPCQEAVKHFDETRFDSPESHAGAREGLDMHHLPAIIPSHVHPSFNLPSTHNPTPDAHAGQLLLPGADLHPISVDAALPPKYQPESMIGFEQHHPVNPHTRDDPVAAIPLQSTNPRDPFYVPQPIGIKVNRQHQPPTLSLSQASGPPPFLTQTPGLTSKSSPKNSTEHSDGEMSQQSLVSLGITLFLLWIGLSTLLVITFIRKERRRELMHNFWQKINDNPVLKAQVEAEAGGVPFPAPPKRPSLARFCRVTVIALVIMVTLNIFLAAVQSQPAPSSQSDVNSDSSDGQSYDMAVDPFLTIMVFLLLMTSIYFVLRGIYRVCAPPSHPSGTLDTTDPESQIPYVPLSDHEAHMPGPQTPVYVGVPVSAPPAGATMCYAEDVTREHSGDMPAAAVV